MSIPGLEDVRAALVPVGKRLAANIVKKNSKVVDENRPMKEASALRRSPHRA